MIIETEHLILRPWDPDDAADLYRYARDPRVGPAAGWPVHTSEGNSRQIIREVLSTDETYAVCLKTDSRPIGSIGLIPPQHTLALSLEKEREIGYWLGVPFWGQGLMPEAVQALLAHAFLELGCTAVWCGYYDGNEKSRRCQEKCGFSYHHTEPDKPCELMGDVRTEHFTRLIRQDWLLSQGYDPVQVQRIASMERIFDRASHTISALSQGATLPEALLSDMQKLTTYYESPQWMQDYDDDSRGKLPRQLKRGVLSQDGLYALLSEYDGIIKI